MGKLKIDRRSVEALSVGDVVYDTRLVGFGARRSSVGISYWIEYRPSPGGRGVPKRRMVIGRDGPEFRADRARAQAEKLLAQVRLGEDPAGDRSAKRVAESVEDVVSEYRVHLASVRKAKTLASFDSIARKYLIPSLGTKPAAQVVRADVARMHRSIGQTHPTTANRTVAWLKAAYAHSIRTGRLPASCQNPASGLTLNREQRRERYLSEEEYKRLGATLALAESEGLPWATDDKKQTKQLPKGAHTTKLDPAAVGAIRLLLLTGARLREILLLEWQMVDLDRGLIFLPDSKTGRKTLVLGGAALAVLRGLPRVCPYVIPGAPTLGPNGTVVYRPRADLKKPWARVTQHAKLDGLRLHDLRHSFASIGAGAGMGLPIIGALLGHADSKTTARYAHLDAGPLRRASDAISASISAALSGEPS